MRNGSRLSQVETWSPNVETEGGGAEFRQIQWTRSGSRQKAKESRPSMNARSSKRFVHIGYGFGSWLMCFTYVG